MTILTDTPLTVDHLRTFFSASQESAAIRQSPPLLPYTPTDGETSFEEISTLVWGYILTLTSYLFYAIGFSDFSKTTWVDSRHIFANATVVKTARIFQNHLLATSINTHRKDSEEYFLRSDESTPLETHPNNGLLQFFHAWGMCRGMCHWFIHLYFKTHGMLTDSDQWMHALGNQFAQGAPNHAAFLHSLNYPSIKELLHLEIQRDFANVSANQTQEEIAQAIMKNPPGIYAVYTSSHCMVFIQLANSAYFFDPNKGVIKIDSVTILQQALEEHLNAHDNKKDILVDLYSSYA